jgi:deoxyribodipyrimidine photo-lyase
VRQNAASLLTKDLGIDWRAGAEWFQFLLEDHCVGANWGNWMYFSGVGGDPKQRHFRTISQALKYDPDGAYVAKWLPKLDGVFNVEARLRPWEYMNDRLWIQILNLHGQTCEHCRFMDGCVKVKVVPLNNNE